MNCMLTSQARVGTTSCNHVGLTSVIYFFNFIYLILDFITTWLSFMEIIVMVGLSWSDNFNVYTPLSFFVTTSPWRPVTEEMSNDEATLTCSVATYERCKVRVELLLSGTDEQGIKKGGYSCYHHLKLPKYHQTYKDRLNSLKCKVRDGVMVQEFAFRPRPSGEKPNEFLVFFLVIRLQVLLSWQDQTQWPLFLSSV